MWNNLNIECVDLYSLLRSLVVVPLACLLVGWECGFKMPYGCQRESECAQTENRHRSRGTRRRPKVSTLTIGCFNNTKEWITFKSKFWQSPTRWRRSSRWTSHSWCLGFAWPKHPKQDISPLWWRKGYWKDSRVTDHTPRWRGPNMLSSGAEGKVYDWGHQTDARRQQVAPLEHESPPAGLF